MKVVYSPIAVPEECFLKEALDWVAFNQFPEAGYTVDAKLLTDAEDCFYDDIPETSYLDYMPVDVCKKFGLEISPEDDYLINDKYKYRDSFFIYKMLNDPDLDKKTKKELEKDLPLAIEYELRYEKFEKSLDDYLETYKLRLADAIVSGKIKTYGRKINILEEPEDDYFPCPPYEEILQKEWKFENINWIECTLNKDDIIYKVIKIKTSELLEVFPYSYSTNTVSALAVGSCLVVESNRPSVLSEACLKQRGRPSLDWESFHIEVAYRINKEGLPDKLEAFIMEMQTWCVQNWNRDVGRSTILQKLSPYYKKFKKS